MEIEPRTPVCRGRAPSSPFASAVPCRVRPALGAGFAPAGTRTRSRESPFRKWRSTPRPLHAGRSCLPAPALRAVVAARRSSDRNGVQPLDRCTLDDLVFQRRHSERSLPPVGLRYVHSTHRLRSVRASLQPCRELLEIFFQLLPVVPPCLPVHARRGFLLQSKVSHTERFEVVDVVQKRREPQLLILFCCLTYPLQRAGRVCPARCPGRVLLSQVPFGQPPSLHPLRIRLPGVVRGLLRYYGSVRLP